MVGAKVQDALCMAYIHDGVMVGVGVQDMLCVVCMEPLELGVARGTSGAVHVWKSGAGPLPIWVYVGGSGHVVYLPRLGSLIGCMYEWGPGHIYACLSSYIC